LVSGYPDQGLEELLDGLAFPDVMAADDDHCFLHGILLPLPNLPFKRAGAPQALAWGAPAHSQYMSSPPPPFFSSLGISATSASLVKSSVATLAAFCSALRTTFVGSMMPAFTMSVYSSLRASKP